MSSFDKIVKLACKPKSAAPKAKYLDAIIAATWSDDGAVSDVCKALVPRIREPNVIVVFKALLVLHMMIRNGATDNVLGYLSQTDILRLKNVSAANWEGYAAPENLQNYAAYLESRIRAYRDLKHDAIRVQSDTNRDMRNSTSLGGGDDSTNVRGKQQQQQHLAPPASTGPTRSKTIIGRKLRVMTVEKGLLRETKIVHHMIDALVECRFYLDDLEDELNIEATRMLVKDLLILFQAGNEGVINVLEHYFEMSHIDAEEALQIYRHFCKQTEKVVEYLSIARKLQNLLNVPIPNLKHAPVSLAGALQEYLDDPNFEDNRLEYRQNKKATETETRRSNGDSKSKKGSAVKFKEQEPPVPKLPASESSTSTKGASTSNGQSKDVVDFFSAIEQEQTSMFAPSNKSPTQPAFNPFAQMMTGQPFGQAPQISIQNTGFLVPQQTAFQTPAAPNPFNAMLGAQQQQQQPTGHQPFSAFLPTQATGMQQPQMTGFPQQPQFQQTQPQQTGFLQPQPQQQQTNFLQPTQTGFLQPQATGSNPFRQSMLMPQSTGTALFNNAANSANSSTGANLFGQHPGGSSAPHSAGPFTASTSFSSFSPQPIGNSSSAFASIGLASANKPPIDVPNRPQSTPLTSVHPAMSMQPVKTHQTGTKNPFGPVITAPPPVPKVPTLMELSMGFASGNAANGANNTQQQQQQGPNQAQGQAQSTSSTQSSTTTGGFNFLNSSLNAGATDISSIASSFTGVGKNNNGPTSQPSQSAPTFTPLQPQHTITPSVASSSNGSSLFSSGLSSQQTGATSVSSTSSGPTPSFNPAAFSATSAASPPAPLKSQITGFAGLKPFKPSSSFGTAMVDSLPPVPPASNDAVKDSASPAGGIQPQHTVTPGSSLFSSSFSTNTNGSSALSSSTSLQGALNSQQTGATGSFGSSMFSSAATQNRPNFGLSLNSQATGAPSGPFAGSTTPAGSGNPSNSSGFTPSFSFNGPTAPQQQQQQQQTQSTLGIGLRPQMTGGGAANPFRASMANPGGSSPPPQIPPLPMQFTAMGGAGGQQGSFMGGAFSSQLFGQQGQTPVGQQGQQQQQQQAQPLF